MVLTVGDQGEEVKQLQIWLNKLGYLTVIDGSFGKQTNKNLKQFQTDNGLFDDGLFGPLSLNVMTDKINHLPKEQTIIKVSNSEYPWMDWMERNIGQHEVTGAGANPFITDLFRYTSLKNSELATTDETAWCAACVNAALIKNGYKGTNSAAADSFDDYGQRLEKPEYGCVITLRHANGARHVCFFVGFTAMGRIIGLGGNQGNELCKKNYPFLELISARWPTKMTQ